MGRPLTEPVDLNYCSQAWFAKKHSVASSTVTNWKKRGLVVFNDRGLVDVRTSEKLLAARPQVYRGGTTAGHVKPPGEASPMAASGDAPPGLPFDNELAAAGVPASDENWTLADAARVKEIYLARQRRLEFEVEQGRFVEIELVGEQQERCNAIVREILLTIPGKLADHLVDKNRAQIEEMLRAEIFAALNELSKPETYTRTRGST